MSVAAQHTHTGQQLLTDLKRMENLVHKHLEVQGDVSTWLSTSTFAVGTLPLGAGVGLELLQKTNLWLGERPTPLFDNFLSDSYPTTLKGLEQMVAIWDHFQEGPG